MANGDVTHADDPPFQAAAAAAAVVEVGGEAMPPPVIASEGDEESGERTEEVETEADAQLRDTGMGELLGCAPC